MPYLSAEHSLTRYEREIRRSAGEVFACEEKRWGVGLCDILDAGYGCRGARLYPGWFKDDFGESRHLYSIEFLSSNMRLTWRPLLLDLKLLFEPDLSKFHNVSPVTRRGCCQYSSALQTSLRQLVSQPAFHQGRNIFSSS